MIGSRILLVLACLALASCGRPKIEEAGAETYGECDGGGVTANTCRKVAGITRCHVFVSERAGLAPRVYPYILQTPGPTIGASAPTTVIVWHVVGNGKFRDRADGAVLSASSPEFSDGTPASDFDGDVVAPSGSPHFRMRYLNSVVPPRPYKYTIKFLNSEGRVVTCDPLIHNAGG